MTKYSFSRPLLIALFLCLFPLGIWATMIPFALRWSDVATTLRSLGQITGILGIVLFSYTFILSARFPITERILGPLNRIYTAHHTLGILAFIFLLCHPMSLIGSTLLLDPSGVSSLLIPSTNISLTLGILSLWILILLLVLTLYIRPRYGMWRALHRFLGLALLFGGLHGLLISSDVSTSFLLKSFLISLSGLGLCSFFLYTILHRFTVRRFSYLLTQVNRLSDTVLSLSLTPQGPSMQAQAGQFIFIRFFLNGAWSEVHPFSLTTPPNQTDLSLSIKALGDDTKRFVDSLQQGTRVQIEGPFGAFGAEMQQAPRSICIAGGIGTTPFLSLLSSLGPTQYADMYYAVNTPEEGVYLHELLRIASEKQGKVRIFPWYAKTQGYLTAQIIEKTSALTSQDHFFLCGPPPMMHALRKQLKQGGVQENHIHSEEFSFE